MIKPGVCLCPVCGHVSTNPYYTNSEHGIGAWLKKSSKLKQTYYLEPYYAKPAGDPEAPDDPEPANNPDPLRNVILQLTDPEAIAKTDGMPDWVEAYLGNDATPIILQRSCPFCHQEDNRVTRFHSFIGKVHMYVVPVIGITTAGKSAWLGALSSGTLNALNRQDYPYVLEPALPNSLVELSGHTPKAGYGNSNFIRIFKKTADGVAKEPAALVLMLDTAGENYMQFQLSDIFTANPHVDSRVSRLIHGDGTDLHPGIDAAVIIDPAVYDQTLQINLEKGQNIGAICSGIREQLLDIPVAYVHSFGDQLIRKEEVQSKTEKRPPRVTKYTFPNTICSEKYIDHVAKYFSPLALKERIRLQDHICRTLSYSTYNSNIIGGVKCGFLVQSCVPGKGTPSKDNYEEQFNVADPLIWLLTQLRLFSLRPRKGGEV